jgi:mannose-6-phosphate isomerase
MAIEHASSGAVHKPWGSTNLRPWSDLDHGGDAVGEIWFRRADTTAPTPALLLKLLFTKEQLSIQVHPDDAFARSIGLEHGKSEAWYILSAAPDAMVATGLTRQITAPQLRAAIEDGSIANLMQWRRVLKGEVVFVPAGTIHSIGPGLVIAEIQQSSDATYRLFDHGRQRQLHLDNAVAAARAGPAQDHATPRHLTDARTLLVASPHFVLEHIHLAPKTSWKLNADHETWMLVVEGHARVGLMNALHGEAIFLEDECTRIEVGSGGMRGLLAYVSTQPIPGLLRNLDSRHSGLPVHLQPQPRPPTVSIPAGSVEARP